MATDGLRHGTVTAERRVITVLFADLVGFTGLAEAPDPEDVATVQDAYFAHAADAIGRNGGRVEKYIGDAVVGVFGVPSGTDDDAVGAVRAVVEIVDAVAGLAASLPLQPEALRVRVGGAHRRGRRDLPRRAQRSLASHRGHDERRGQAAVRCGTGHGAGRRADRARRRNHVRPRTGRDARAEGHTEPVAAWRVLGPSAQPRRTAALDVPVVSTIGRDVELAGLEAGLAGRVLAGHRTAGRR